MFDIQRFTDTVTSSADLKIGYAFADGDTRLVSLPNPKTGLTKAMVDTVNATIISGGLLIGDQAGAAITGSYTAYTEASQKTVLDISGGE